MTKIDQDYLVSLKERFDLVAIIGETVKLRPAGNGEFKGRCPFHDENTASFSVNRDRYHCFGCHVHGDLFEWIVRTQGKTFPQAVKSLASGSPVIVQDEAIRKRSIPNHTPYDAKAVERIIEVNRALQYDILFEGHPAIQKPDDISIDYMFDRFGEDEGIGVGVGYAPNDPTAVIEFMEERYGFGVDRLSEAGLVAQGTDGGWYSRLRDRVTLPLCNMNGDILGFVGRIVPRKDNEKLPKYVNPPTTQAYEKKRHLFGIERFDKNIKTCVLVEGQIDAVSLYMAGIPNVLSIGGSKFSRQQHDIINSLGVEKVFFMMDGDMPGLIATFEATKFINDANYAAFNILLSEGRDPDSLVKAMGSRTQDVKKAIRSLPIIKSQLFYSKQLEVRYLKPKYDRSFLDKLALPYVMDNIKNGWPHYNVVDWVMAAYPEYAKDIKVAALNMARDVVEGEDGTKILKEENVKRFLKEWLKPSKEVRRIHSGQFKTKRS